MVKSRTSALLIIVLSLGLYRCNDKPPIVIIVPPTETPREVIDQFYYVQFQWGKPKYHDTITIEVPDDTTTLASKNDWDTLKDYFNIPYDLKNEPIKDSTNAYEKTLLDETILRMGWHYAPSSSFYNWKYISYHRNPTEYQQWDNKKVNKDVFTISFPWRIWGPMSNDTLPFWDIQDYLANPSIHVGDIKWGRVGNNIIADTLYMLNNDAFSGAVVTYIDHNGTRWSSDNPPTFQIGDPPSYFVIKKMYRNERDKESYYIIEGEFTGKLYDEYGGQMVAAGGKFRCKILTDVELGDQPE